MAKIAGNKLTIKFVDGAELVLQEGVGYVSALGGVTVQDAVLKVLTLDCDKNMCDHSFNMTYVKSWTFDIFREET